MVDNVIFRTKPDLPKRIVFPPALVAPVETKDDKGVLTGNKQYQVNFLLDQGDMDLAEMYKGVHALFAEVFPDRTKAAMTLAAQHGKPNYGTFFDAMATLAFTPFSRGDAIADKREAAGKKADDLLRGKVLVKATKPEKRRDGSLLPPPSLGGAVRGQAVAFDTPDLLAQYGKMFYSGADVHFEIAFSPYTAGRGGVKAYLNFVMALGTGERIGGNGALVEAMTGYMGSLSSVNPLVDSDLPF